MVGQASRREGGNRGGSCSGLPAPDRERMDHRDDLADRRRDDGPCQYAKTPKAASLTCCGKNRPTNLPTKCPFLCQQDAAEDDKSVQQFS
mmetsp:Transcript_3275/g.7779  ORF Transcript_3275/g.7779 Transcript_3275/m.7779 type:complete len:90 (-) Transcript_3275:395-664(-)